MRENTLQRQKVGELMARELPEMQLGRGDQMWSSCFDESGNTIAPGRLLSDSEKCSQANLNYDKTVEINNILSKNLDTIGSLTGWEAPTASPAFTAMDSLPEGAEVQRHSEKTTDILICPDPPRDITETQWIELVNEKDSSGKQAFKYCVENDPNGGGCAKDEFAKVASSNIIPIDTCKHKLKKEFNGSIPKKDRSMAGR